MKKLLMVALIIGMAWGIGKTQNTVEIGTVTKCIGNDNYIVDEYGEEWIWIADDLEPGDKVEMTIFDNETMGIEDDEIIKLKIIK